MNVDPAEAAAHQAMALYEREHLMVRRNGHGGQCVEKTEDFFTLAEIAATELADYERMRPDDAVVQLRDKRGVPAAQMVDPYGRVGEQVDYFEGERRRRTGRSRFSTPPRAARRRALSRAISASKPACTMAVFSRIPVSCRARSSRSSSMIKVVLICMNMVGRCIRVNRPATAESGGIAEQGAVSRSGSLVLGGR